MTREPVDIDALEREFRQGVWRPQQERTACVLALIAELRATRSERDYERAQKDYQYHLRMTMRDISDAHLARAERAEDEVRRLTAIIGDWTVDL